jgi:acyl-CoA thioester hydrolase
MPERSGRVENPRSGRIDGLTHRFAVRVYYEDTDAAGIVYHANYLKFAERARTELLRLLGFEHAALRAEEGAAFAVRRCAVDYLRPARLDDEVEIVSRLTALGGATAEILQIVTRDDVELARIDLRLALVAASGRPIRLPPSLREALGPLITP